MTRALVFLATLLVAAGCGGDGGGDRLSEEEFQRQANEICTDLEETLEAMGEADSPEALQQQLEDAEGELRSSLDDLRALEPPEEREEAYDEFLATGDELVDLIADLRRASEDQDVTELQDLSERGDEIDERGDRAAQAAGLEECGSD